MPNLPKALGQIPLGRFLQVHSGLSVYRHRGPHFTLAALLRRLFSNMSVASLQQFGQSLPSWVALVQRGETVAITDGGREVARLVPPEAAHDKPAPAAAPVRWPDFAARRRAIFGEQRLPTGLKVMISWPP